MRKEIATKLLIIIFWLVLISLGRWAWQWSLIWLYLGSILGLFLLETDHWLYVFLSNPHELTSQRVKRLIEQRQFKSAFVLVSDTKLEREKLAFHNVLFQAILVIFCFFAITSTNSLFGIGLLMGMFLSLLLEEIFYLKNHKEEELKQRLFWPVKVELNASQQRIYVLIVVFIFVFLSFLLI